MKWKMDVGNVCTASAAALEVDDVGPVLARRRVVQSDGKLKNIMNDHFLSRKSHSAKELSYNNVPSSIFVPTSQVCEVRFMQSPGR